MKLSDTNVRNKTYDLFYELLRITQQNVFLKRPTKAGKNTQTFAKYTLDCTKYYV